MCRLGSALRPCSAPAVIIQLAITSAAASNADSDRRQGGVQLEDVCQIFQAVYQPQNTCFHFHFTFVQPEAATPVAGRTQ